jgi:rhodanese-related sulfurtransferase
MFREKFSSVLLSFGLILALLPLKESRPFVIRTDTLLNESLDPDSYLSVDQVARLLVNDDKTIQIIDVRTEKEFSSFNIPGSVNVPFKELTVKNPETFLASGKIKNIFYSNGDLNSNYALVIAKGLGYNNCFVMKGGMNEWIKTVMNTTFTGDKISVRENAVFEIRTKACKLFNEINSMPDSLKIKYLRSKRFDPKKLDGGCE